MRKRIPLQCWVLALGCVVYAALLSAVLFLLVKVMR